MCRDDNSVVQYIYNVFPLQKSAYFMYFVTCSISNCLYDAHMYVCMYVYVLFFLNTFNKHDIYHLDFLN
jgi:hypothetical protein